MNKNERKTSKVKTLLDYLKEKFKMSQEAISAPRPSIFDGSISSKVALT